MLARHHGLILVPSYWTMSASSGGAESSFDYLGAELGYHFYTGNRGANGFFVGPSFVFMNMNTSSNVGGGAEASSSTSLYGVAVDFGGQHVAESGFTIGGGMGFMYVKTASEVNTEGATVSVSGTLPRFLFTVGYSF
jgi:hypothetical protein